LKYYLDAEFNGFGGQLISLALVPDDVDAPSFYEAVPCPQPVEWVVDHVLPVLRCSTLSRDEVIARLSIYLRDDPEPVVVADWPEDVAHLALLMIIAPGSRTPSPPVRIELLDLPLFCSEQSSDVPRNALYDAKALREYMIAQEHL
jgi:hypothetical protein